MQDKKFIWQSIELEKTSPAFVLSWPAGNSMTLRLAACLSLQVAWLPGSIALFVVTLILTGGLIVSDHQLIKPVDDLDVEIGKLMAAEKHDSERQDVEAHHLQVYGFSIIPSKLSPG